MKRDAFDGAPVTGPLHDASAAQQQVSGTDFPLLFDLDRVCVRLGPVDALQDVSVRLRHGERVALVGANGCGKSTMLRLLNGLLQPARGRIVRDASARQALLFQRPHMLRTTVRSNIALGLWQRVKIFLRRVGGIILGLTVALWLLGQIAVFGPARWHQAEQARGLVQTVSMFKLDEGMPGVNFDDITKDQIRDLYPRREDFDDLQQEDVDRFNAALMKAGVTPGGAKEPVLTTFLSFDEDVSLRRVGAVLWPSFFAAGVATTVCFAVLDPGAIDLPRWLPRLDAMGIYTLGFAAFWVATTAASAFTALLLEDRR